MRLPTFLLGTYSEVREASIKHARSLVQGASLHALTSQSIDVDSVPNAVIVLDGPNCRSGQDQHFQCSAFFDALDCLMNDRSSGFRKGMFLELLSEEWSFLGTLSQAGQVYMAHYPQLERIFLAALTRHWKALAHIGARYNARGDEGGRHFWQESPILWQPLLRRGVDLKKIYTEQALIDCIQNLNVTN